MGNLDCKFFYNHNFTKIKEKMKKLFLDSVFWKSPGKTHFHSVDCSISVHSVLRTPCTEKEQSTPWKWFYLTFSRKLHKKLLFPRSHFLYHKVIVIHYLVVKYEVVWAMVCGLIKCSIIFSLACDDLIKF